MALLLAIALCNPLCNLIQPAAAQTFPDHYLRLVVPFPPGGATDVLGRILAKRMSEILGQPIVVENHSGAGGTIGWAFDYRMTLSRIKRPRHEHAVFSHSSRIRCVSFAT
jgi:tripartite-type tricarboxylate transporter receptor subunit TctC